MTCTACHGDGQIGMYRDGSPMVCQNCVGTGVAISCPGCGEVWDGRRPEGSLCAACDMAARVDTADELFI